VVGKVAQIAAPEKLKSPSAAADFFRAALLEWYAANQRPLPWRGTRDAYRIWISEVMLQQTRAAVAAERYGQFLARFPTVAALARASLPAVLAAWSGLGYYRRARALRAAARRVMRDFGGRLPRRREELLRLPGIGPYTAAAVASIAYGQPQAVVDGNVQRVLRRLLATPAGNSELLWRVAGQLLDPQRPGDFNQAMMELGATTCLPRQPSCPSCPVIDWCITRGRLPSARRRPQQKKNSVYSLAKRGSAVWLVRRSQQARLMPGMWELPLLACSRVSNVSARQGPSFCSSAPVIPSIPLRPGAATASAAAPLVPLISLRHSITHTDYRVQVVAVAPGRVSGDGRWVRISRLPALPLTGLCRKILRRLRLIK